MAAASFNTVAGWGFGGGTLYDEAKDEFYFAGSSDDYKTMVEYFAGLVQDGLMDPESFTQEDDQADQKLANEQSFAITTNGQELLRERTVLEATKGDDFQLDKIRVPSGPAGDNMRGARIENGFMISSDAKDNDDFVAMLQFLDWLYYSDEGLEFVRWGVEGETFTKDADGNRVLADGIEFLDTNVGADKHFRLTTVSSTVRSHLPTGPPKNWCSHTSPMKKKHGLKAWLTKPSCPPTRPTHSMKANKSRLVCTRLP